MFLQFCLRSHSSPATAQRACHQVGSTSNRTFEARCRRIEMSFLFSEDYRHRTRRRIRGDFLCKPRRCDPQICPRLHWSLRLDCPGFGEQIPCCGLAVRGRRIRASERFFLTRCTQNGLNQLQLQPCCRLLVAGFDRKEKTPRRSYRDLVGALGRGSKLCAAPTYEHGL